VPLHIRPPHASPHMMLPINAVRRPVRVGAPSLHRADLFDRHRLDLHRFDRHGRRLRGLAYIGDGYYPYFPDLPDVVDDMSAQQDMPAQQDDDAPLHLGAVHVMEDPAAQTSYAFAVARTSARPHIVLIHPSSVRPSRRLPLVIYGSVPVDGHW
jgi:hypothetical protein